MSEKCWRVSLSLFGVVSEFVIKRQLQFEVSVCVSL
jgi:hypothetical protein